MNIGEDLRLAPAGASDAACAVCLHMTFNRLAIGDGHVPICSNALPPGMAARA